jgi:DNA-binding CsgD family transcriptional regulator
VEKARKNYKKAIHWAEIQYKNAKENKVLFDITDAANQLGELYYEVGDYKNAFLFSKEKEEKQKEALGDLSAAQLKYQKYRRAMEREKSSKNLLLKNLEISNRKRQVYLFAAFFAVLFSLILLKYLAVNKKLTKEQAEKNVLLEENNQYIREKNNQINQLNQRLSAKSAKLEESYLQNMLFLTNKNELIKKLNLLAKEEVNDIGDLKKGLSQLLRQEQKENDWKEMEYQLEIANQEFTANLYRKHPNLSPLEMRLCIFLKLNMTTKEIAALTLRKPDSVKVARSRLKKKLQLDNTQKLNVYLNNI